MVKIIITVLTILIGSVSIATSEFKEVTFKSTCKTSSGEQLLLTGKLRKPKGRGPFPAVVLLHTSFGLGMYEGIWAKRIEGWGYVSLQVDSFGPRVISNNIMDRDLDRGYVRAQDAYDANPYLAGLRFVDNKRIGVIGWSHGGWATLHVVFNKNYSEPFKVAVAFYPICDVPFRATSPPLLILSGELDANMPSDCVIRSAAFRKMHPEVTVKIYPREDHFFDWYDTKAAADAIIQVKKFLAVHLK